MTEEVRIRATFDVELKITQFPLHPDTPPEGMALEQLVTRSGAERRPSD